MTNNKNKKNPAHRASRMQRPQQGDYVPYGPEWVKELSRLTKPQIIGIYRSALISLAHAWATPNNIK